MIRASLASYSEFFFHFSNTADRFYHAETVINAAEMKWKYLAYETRSGLVSVPGH